MEGEFHAVNQIHKLYLFEGMDEQEAASLALEKKEQLQKEGRMVKHFTTGMWHPADLSSLAYLSIEEYHQFLHDVLIIWNHDKGCTKEELMENIFAQTHLEDDHAIIAYRQICFPNAAYECLISDLAAREVYDGRLTYPEFRSLHLRRWRHFCKMALNTPNTAYIFENTLFRNHIQELMGFYDMEDERILMHLEELLQQVTSLNPVLCYRHPECISEFVTQKKRCDHEWFEHLSYYVSHSNYGRLRGLQGNSGAVTFLLNRERIESLSLERFSRLSPELTISLSEYNNEYDACN